MTIVYALAALVFWIIVGLLGLKAGIYAVAVVCVFVAAWDQAKKADRREGRKV